MRETLSVFNEDRGGDGSTDHYIRFEREDTYSKFIILSEKYLGKEPKLLCVLPIDEFITLCKRALEIWA